MTPPLTVGNGKLTSLPSNSALVIGPFKLPVMNGSISPPSSSGRDDSSQPSSCFLDSLLMPVFAVNVTGTVTDWNATLSSLTGLRRQDVLRRKASTILDERSRSNWDRFFCEAQTGRQCDSVDVMLPSADAGEPISFKLRLVWQQALSHGNSCSHPRASEILGALCFLERLPNVSNSSRRECSGRNDQRAVSTPNGHLSSDHFSQDDIRISSDACPVFIMESNGSITYWNQKMTELTGYTFHEIQSNPHLLAGLFINGVAHVQALFAEPVAGSGSTIHAGIRSFSGEIQQISLCPILVADTSTGGDLEVAVFVHRLSDETLLEGNTYVAVVGVDSDGRIDLWNPAVENLLSIEAVDALGKHLHDIFPLACYGPKSRSVLEHAWSGNANGNFILDFQSQSRGQIHLRLNASPRSDSQGTINGARLLLHDVTELHRRYRVSMAEAQELRQLVDTASTPIFGVDASGFVNEWNDKMCEATGYARDDALAEHFVEKFVAARHFDSVQNVLLSALAGRGTTNYELEVIGKDGETRYFLMNATTRRDAHDNVVGMVGFAHDVTEASKHDRAIASMASELRQLIDNANAPIFGIDCDGDVNEWNDKTAEITGYTKEEAFDCSLVETFIAPSMQESVQDILDRALQGRGTSNYELEFLTKSNEIRNLLVNATTRRDAENNVVGVVGVAQDVTEAVQRDKAVAGMALELRQLVDTANAPIFGIDIDGNVNEWNRRTQEITGYSKEETFDEPLVERFVAPAMREAVQNILDQALQGNETSNFELEFVTKSGEPCFMLVNATTRRDPEFNVVGVVSVAQDVTEDRKHAAELRKMQYLQATQEAKVETERNMTAYFAHELRNPLSAIDSALSAMPDDLPKSAKSLVTGMQLCSTFMSTIMNNLLDVRKMEEGKMTLHVVPMSLEALMSGVHKMLLPSVKPGVAFTKFVVTKGRDWVLGDQHRIQQVLTNVVTNAIKYTVTGSIELKLSWEGDAVKFECCDSGPGIPKNEQEKLFQRFVQRGGAPGTGLGLAIAKHLVDLHHGKIRFDSDPTVKAGTTCIVLMPLSLCDPPEVKEDEANSMIEQPIKFLIIDDVKMNRIMLKRRIKKGIAPNCSVSEASTGEEALEICGNDNFDVIIVDQYMEEAGGVMVGTDVVYAMRRMRIDSIIIGCSGNDLDREFTEAGANWVWKKPMPTNAEIISHLRQALIERANAMIPSPISVHAS